MFGMAIVKLFLLIIITINYNFVNGFFLGPTIGDIMTIGQLKNGSLLLITKDEDSYVIHRNRKDDWTNTWPISYGNMMKIKNRWPWMENLSIYQQFLKNDRIRDTSVVVTLQGDDAIAIIGYKNAILLNLDRKSASIIDVTRIKNFNQIISLSTMNRTFAFMENDTKTLSIIQYRWDTFTQTIMDYMYCSDNMVVINGRCKPNQTIMPFPMITNVFLDEKSFVILFTDDGMVYKFPMFSGPIVKTKKLSFLNVETFMNQRLGKFLESN